MILFLLVSSAALAWGKDKSAVPPATSSLYNVDCHFTNGIDNSYCVPHECHPPRTLVNGVCQCPCDSYNDPEDSWNCIPHGGGGGGQGGGGSGGGGSGGYSHCTDYVPNIFPPTTYHGACGEYGVCNENHNGTITCVCDGCHYGAYCQNVIPACIPTPETCPPTDCRQCTPPFTCPPPHVCPPQPGHSCNDFIPDFFPPTRYGEVCGHGGRCVDVDANNHVNCDCGGPNSCWTGPFCEVPTFAPGCENEPVNPGGITTRNPICPPCPGPIDCVCPPPVTCPPPIECPPPPPPSCNDIVTYQYGRIPVTYNQVCAGPDLHTPNGVCSEDGGPHCVCNDCWDGIFCEHYDAAKCGNPGCPSTLPPPTPEPITCSSVVPGLESGKTYNQACEVDFHHSHGVCVDHFNGTISCACNDCWGGVFCEIDTCPPPPPVCPEITTAPPPAPLTCDSNVPNLFPVQTYKQACEVDPHDHHGECIPAQTGDGHFDFQCVCNSCWTGTFCEEFTCTPPCPEPTPPPAPTCSSPIPDWASGRTFDEECGATDGRGKCVEERGRLACQCNECWTGDFCEQNACIRRCAYNELRPAFYHNPPSPYLFPQPVGGSDLPDDLLACPKGYECVPDDKNCHYNRQECINNVGWCLPAYIEQESPAHPEDNIRAPKGAMLKDAVPKKAADAKTSKAEKTKTVAKKSKTVAKKTDSKAHKKSS